MVNVVYILTMMFSSLSSHYAVKLSCKHERAVELLRKRKRVIPS